MKDNFSQQSEQYLKFRPNYPVGLYDFLLSLIETKETAWDCGTGNGQVAQELAKYFQKVYATDISEKQIAHAVQKPAIIYKIEPAEKTSFPRNFFDLVTVAQAIHWFDFDQFYKEVKRTMKPGGVLAVIGYGLIKTGEETDKLIGHFYQQVIGPYWDTERKYIDENYQTIPFPFEEISTPQFKISFDWDIEQFVGYLNTWSAVQHFIKANNYDPVETIRNELEQLWGEKRAIDFPVLLRVARL